MEYDVYSVTSKGCCFSKMIPCRQKELHLSERKQWIRNRLSPIMLFFPTLAIQLESCEPLRTKVGAVDFLPFIFCPSVVRLIVYKV